ncbi:helix-turn-helix domain-containing protein [Ruminococcus sp. FMB-CY1]|uniref:helix-turn-helix domain-containing protein n=1 Tax=unclassified Ruminococcus TaxID=2608920 RepID=UPI00208F2D64|nr:MULTISPECIES: helix-turn-helix domain-containing protein [unclassified Ruminococcus]USP68901.1 helix-turn-helix domain-containing protein [Ruminococcus sp. FMBCY1]WBX57796.1 helix-turn-helix domain-containing protein [Ruminococcus sp. FMB-CY1]
MKSKTIVDWDEVPVIVDVPYVARLLGFKAETITEKCRRKKIPAHKVLNEWRFYKEELQEFLREE